MWDRSYPGRGHLPEVSHEPDDASRDADGYLPELTDWDGSDQADWPAADDPGPGERGRRHGPRRAARWLVLGLVVFGLAAGGGAALAKVTSGGSSRVALSGDGTTASAAPSAGAAPSTGTVTPSADSAPSARRTTAAARPSATASPATASPDMGRKVGNGEAGPGTLAGVLTAANASVEGKGLLAPANCDQYRQNGSGAIVCAAPVPGVGEVFYQNYSSLSALYAAYQAQIALLDGGTFRQNSGTCGDSAVSYAEFGWNQEEGHPHNFTVAQMAAGRVPQIFAGGRMACFVTHTKNGVSQDIVWTIDNGRAMGVEIGRGAPKAVYDFWAALHHTVLFRGTEMCGTAGRMNMNDIPTGNLKVFPVCPAGVEAVPAG